MGLNKPKAGSSVGLNATAFSDLERSFTLLAGVVIANVATIVIITAQLWNVLVVNLPRTADPASDICLGREVVIASLDALVSSTPDSWCTGQVSDWCLDPAGPDSGF